MPTDAVPIEVIDAVGLAIREVGRDEVLERFRALEAGDIDEKSPGDFVTIADRECERVLGARLREIRDVAVVGEEATELDPGLVRRIAADDAVWVVDPVDGTANFVDGSPDFAVMVALVEASVTTAAWIWLPVSDRMVTATLGGGAFDDGKVHARPPADAGSGILKDRFIPEPTRTSIGEVRELVTVAADRRCAGVEYLDLIDGAIDFLFYWRAKPWDHAPGVLIAAEAGLRAARLDGRAWLPSEADPGLLSATPDVFARLAPELLSRADR